MAILNEILKEIINALEKKDQNKLRELFDDIHPYDIGQVLINIDTEKRSELFDYLSNAELAEAIQELEYDDQKIIIDDIGMARASEILVEMSYDDAVDLIGELDEEEKEEIFSLMDDEEEANIKELLRYPENSAGGLMTTEYVYLPINFTAEEAIAKLRDMAPEAETVYYLYVIDKDERLIGVLSLRDLIIAKPETKVSDIMYERIVSVPIDMDQEEVAKTMEKYSFLAIPVVDKDNKLVGIVTVDDAMDVLKEEASEDMAKFGGISGKDAGEHDLNVRAFEAAKKRIPWLALLLGIGILAGNIIDYFEETLQAVVVLAVFIPMIADMAGNTGTQSLAVVVRGLAMGEFTTKDAFQLIKRESGVGVIIGLTNGVLITLIVALWQQSLALGLVIGASLSITLFFATLAGAAIPLIMVRLKIDPAIASGPFITTVNDIVGLTIYFSIATMFMSYLV